MDDINWDFIVEKWDTFSTPMQLAYGIVIGLLAICAVVAIVISIVLAISYIKYNRKKNSVHMTGEKIARKILDMNGLNHIKVKCSGSILFGNSYSHYFKKVRLRRLTWKKDSVTSLAMASQKSCLAILDKEKDPDMKSRVRLTPFIYFGPVFCLPIILIGAALDVYVLHTDGMVSVLAAVLGLVLYLISFLMSLKVLKTEKKAQARACEVVRQSGLATAEEVEDMKKLFKLYNIEYVNDMIVALLELILRILTIVSDMNVSTDK